MGDVEIAAAQPERALESVVVLDLGQVYNGPYCTMLLQELGADVVKIEPFDGEPIRWRADGGDGNPAFQLLNAGKRSLRLDLKNDRGRELFLRMVEVADVVVENFAPGVMDRLGLSYASLKVANPRVVLASGKGYGSTGPHSHLRGMDVTVQSMTAIVATTGFPDQAPVKAGPAVVDFSAGVHLASAILAALFQRERTGRGQHVEVSMQDAIIPSLASNIGGYLEHGESFPDRTGNRHGGLNVVPYNVYPASDGWVAILCVRNRHWLALCRLMDRDDLADDPALHTAQGRVERMDELDDAVGAWTRTHAKMDLFELLQDADIPSAPVRTLSELVNDEHVRHRGMLRELGAGERNCTIFGSPLRLGDSVLTLPSAPPQLGEHSDEVLADLLRLDRDELRDLRENKVI